MFQKNNLLLFLAALLLAGCAGRNTLSNVKLATQNKNVLYIKQLDIEL